MNRSLITSEWYENFIEELKSILSESRFSVQLDILRGKWELGRRITEEELSFKKVGYGDKIVETIAKELDISDSQIWRCIQFYKKFPQPAFDGVVEHLGEGKTPTWFKVCSEILPAHTEHNTNVNCTHENLMCLKCRKRFKKGEI